MYHELRSSEIRCAWEIRHMNSRFHIFTLGLCNQTKYNYKKHQVCSSAGMSWGQSTKINLSSSGYLTPEGMWAVLTLQLSTQMQKCWWEQRPGEPHPALQPRPGAPVTLLPRTLHQLHWWRQPQTTHSLPKAIYLQQFAQPATTAIIFLLKHGKSGRNFKRPLSPSLPQGEL